jgi:hypothetical protein
MKRGRYDTLLSVDGASTRSNAAVMNGKRMSRYGDVLYEASGNSHVGLPTLVYVRPGLATDLTDEMKKKIDTGECR